MFLSICSLSVLPHALDIFCKNQERLDEPKKVLYILVKGAFILYVDKGEGGLWFKSTHVLIETFFGGVTPILRFLEILVQF